MCCWAPGLTGQAMCTPTARHHHTSTRARACEGMLHLGCPPAGRCLHPMHSFLINSILSSSTAGALHFTPATNPVSNGIIILYSGVQCWLSTMDAVQGTSVLATTAAGQPGAVSILNLYSTNCETAQLHIRQQLSRGTCILATTGAQPGAASIPCIHFQLILASAVSLLLSQLVILAHPYLPKIPL